MSPLLISVEIFWIDSAMFLFISGLILILFMIYGKPVFQFLLEYKMAMAKRFLIEEDYNINEVSIKLGYSTASHFISSFKKRYGVTPKVYVKNFYKN